jgi:recombination protein RecA
MKDKENIDLRIAIEKVNKVHGKDTIKPLKSLPDMSENIISTGIEELDNTLGVGGTYKGSILEIFGPESTGKTSLALHIAKQYQKMNLPILYINSERTLTKEAVKNIGINEDGFFVSDTNALENALDICIDSASGFGIIIVDSLTGLIPKEQREGVPGDKNLGLSAKIISSALPMLIEAINKNKCTLIFINQIRERLGVIFGNPEISTGGRALKHYASVRIDMRKLEVIKKNGVIVGDRVRAKVVKNKISAPHKEAVFDILYGIGIKEIETPRRCGHTNRSSNQ